MCMVVVWLARPGTTMAEARHAVTIGAHVTGVKLNLDDDGLAVDFSFTIPLRWSIIRPRLARQAERLRNAIINGSYPLGPVALVVLMAGITTLYVVVIVHGRPALGGRFPCVQRAVTKCVRVRCGVPMCGLASVLAVERDHWIRQGALAHFVWNVGHWFPFVESLPLLPRVGLLTLWAVFVGFFLLTMLQRILLRLLFSYQVRVVACVWCPRAPLTVPVRRCRLDRGSCMPAVVRLRCVSSSGAWLSSF